MLKKKSSEGEKKRKHPPPDERHRNSKRRSAESNVEDEFADPELDRVGSDIEEGGLDLGVPFKPINAYVGDKKKMLEQCFGVLGEKKLRRMLPEPFKDLNLEVVRRLCWEQLEPISERNIMQILSGGEVTEEDNASQQNSQKKEDDNMDSTAKEPEKTENAQKEGTGSNDESDVLSIDAGDSDIDAPKEEPPGKTAEIGAGGHPSRGKKDIQSDIDRSVSEILAPAEKEASAVVRCRADTGADAAPCPPSIQQLELLELEMRARAIKALMKASHGKMS
ncbi:caspase activity and apoptosis inhibitor 1 [Corythoichthys intestinalis]|uniref:caspase activity and apoptosis inhibitor 1 n=1 Tax=Corythoichthys intestinalis TaxID=161448 RepID=UPI0025A56AD4|nr:caspase activity and apoptosis inhibitor 1 [Corythoichthys intestinalis]XP_061810950.1 caspase activity and apoptosis inhibitor 1-like [Nerophis lumbriciformis]